MAFVIYGTVIVHIAVKETYGRLDALDTWGKVFVDTLPTSSYACLSTHSISEDIPVLSKALLNQE